MQSPSRVPRKRWHDAFSQPVCQRLLLVSRAGADHLSHRAGHDNVAGSTATEDACSALDPFTSIDARPTSRHRLHRRGPIHAEREVGLDVASLGSETRPFSISLKQPSPSGSELISPPYCRPNDRRLSNAERLASPPAASWAASTPRALVFDEPTQATPGGRLQLQAGWPDTETPVAHSTPLISVRASS